MTNEFILQIEDLTKRYQSKNGIETTALEQFTFGVKKNEMVAIMGSSGSGKTTLINILTGLLDWDEGKVYYNHQDILDFTKEQKEEFRRRNIGIVFQNYNLIDSLTVEENIMVPLILDERYDGQKEKVKAIASLLGISEQLEKYPYELSGGQQQRVGICRAMIHKPGIIFADEPTGNLDSKSTEQVMECFVNACREKKSSLLMVTHDAKAASYCDRVVFLCDGHVKAEIARKTDKDNEFYTSVLEMQKGVIA